MSKILALVSFFLITSCSTSLTKTAYSIETGMSKKAVVQRMGLPDRRSMRGNDEALR